MFEGEVVMTWIGPQEDEIFMTLDDVIVAPVCGYGDANTRMARVTAGRSQSVLKGGGQIVSVVLSSQHAHSKKIVQTL